jgi:hypothetical protein
MIYRMFFLIGLYTLQQGNLCGSDYARKYKELILKCGTVESERITITRFKSGFIYELNK